MTISRRTFLATGALSAASIAAQTTTAARGATPAPTVPGVQGADLVPVASTGAQDRAYWVSVVDRMARPILTALKNGRLLELLRSRKNSRPERAEFAPLEALGRLLAGIAPFLESGSDEGDEGRLRGELNILAREGIRVATDPAAPARMVFNRGGQPLVDTAFLCHAFLRAPGELWEKLEAGTKKNVIEAVISSRAIRPSQSNWLLFSAMVEAFVAKAGAEWLRPPVETALSRHEEWYKADGAYGDGPYFHWDYYNSFVIQPMLIDVIETLKTFEPGYEKHRGPVLARARRYAEVQERMISPEGAFPMIGRSIVYRYGAFQLLAQVALRRELPREIKPAQVRCALTSAIRRITEFPGTFDQDGVLTLGVCGSQPTLAESYISPGSLYLASFALLPLGLSASDPFWSAPAADWTSRQIFGGAPSPAIDKALPGAT